MYQSHEGVDEQDSGDRKSQQNTEVVSSKLEIVGELLPINHSSTEVVRFNNRHLMFN